MRHDAWLVQRGLPVDEHRVAAHEVPPDLLDAARDVRPAEAGRWRDDATRRDAGRSRGSSRLLWRHGRQAAPERRREELRPPQLPSGHAAAAAVGVGEQPGGDGDALRPGAAAQIDHRAVRVLDKVRARVLVRAVDDRAAQYLHVPRRDGLGEGELGREVQRDANLMRPEVHVGRDDGAAAEIDALAHHVGAEEARLPLEHLLDALRVLLVGLAAASGRVNHRRHTPAHLVPRGEVPIHHSLVRHRAVPVPTARRRRRLPTRRRRVLVGLLLLDAVQRLDRGEDLVEEDILRVVEQLVAHLCRRPEPVGRHDDKFLKEGVGVERWVELAEQLRLGLPQRRHPLARVRRVEEEGLAHLRRAALRRRLVHLHRLCRRLVHLLRLLVVLVLVVVVAALSVIGGHRRRGGGGCRHAPVPRRSARAAHRRQAELLVCREGALRQRADEELATVHLEAARGTTAPRALVRRRPQRAG
mmetsp:Transcript_49194/g.154534  ORF Transcript_49194/g.154534 Transcript_49194/m.154534 type:complete len:471 (-) Transcript_49194:87-1499(-)